MELRAALGQAASWTHLARGQGVMASIEVTDRSVTTGSYRQELVARYVLISNMKKLVFCQKILSKCQFLAKIMHKMLDSEILFPTF